MPETSKFTPHSQTPDLQSHLPPVTLIWVSSRHLKLNVSKTQLIFLFQLLRPKISVFCSHPFKKSIPSENPTLFVLSSKYIHTMATSHTLSTSQVQPPSAATWTAASVLLTGLPALTLPPALCYQHRNHTKPVPYFKPSDGSPCPSEYKANPFNDLQNLSWLVPPSLPDFLLLFSHSKHSVLATLASLLSLKYASHAVILPPVPMCGFPHTHTKQFSNTREHDSTRF